jgi:hypothetical protein
MTTRKPFLTPSILGELKEEGELNVLFLIVFQPQGPRSCGAVGG